VGKSVYNSDQAGKTNAWSWNPNAVTIVGVDVPVTDENRHFYDRRALVRPDDAFIKTIYANGIKTPISIKKFEGTSYCVSGRRRLLALRIALGWAIERGDTVKEKALVRVKGMESTSNTPEEILTESLIENAHRLDETPVGLGEKMSHARYLGLDINEIAECANCSGEHVRNMLLINDKLTSEAKEKLESGELVLDAALEMCRSMTGAQQEVSLPSISEAPRGEGKSTVQKAAGKTVTKAPKLRFVKMVAEGLSSEQREAVLWARGVLRDEDVSFLTLLEETVKAQAKKPAKKRGQAKSV